MIDGRGRVRVYTCRRHLEVERDRYLDVESEAQEPGLTTGRLGGASRLPPWLTTILPLLFDSVSRMESG